MKLLGPHIAVEDLVPLIPAQAYRPVTVGAHTYWYFTLGVRIPSLGKVRIVVSFEHDQVTGRYLVLVTNRVDWNAAKVIGLYRHRWPTERNLLIMKPLCIYHGLCADGFTAAWVVWKFYGESHMDFHAATHGDRPPEVDDREIYVVDFSYPRPVMEEMARHAKKLTVIDHHITAAQDLEGFIHNDGVVDGIFDMEKSGSLLAWEWFFTDKHPPQALLAVNDRDLWTFERPWTREIFLALTAYPYDFTIWETMMGDDRLETLCQEGTILYRKQQKDIVEIITEGSHLITIAGHTVPACNVPSIWASDAGHILAQGHPFAACFWIDGEQIAFSLRSVPDGLDVSEIAKRFGGGGHQHAAGFKLPWTAYRSRALQEGSAWNGPTPL